MNVTSFPTIPAAQVPPQPENKTTLFKPESYVGADGTRADADVAARTMSLDFGEVTSFTTGSAAEKNRDTSTQEQNSASNNPLEGFSISDLLKALFSLIQGTSNQEATTKEDDASPQSGEAREGGGIEAGSLRGIKAIRDERTDEPSPIQAGQFAAVGEGEIGARWKEPAIQDERTDGPSPVVPGGQFDAVGEGEIGARWKEAAIQDVRTDEPSPIPIQAGQFAAVGEGEIGARWNEADEPSPIQGDLSNVDVVVDENKADRVEAKWNEPVATTGEGNLSDTTDTFVDSLRTADDNRKAQEAKEASGDMSSKEETGATTDLSGFTDTFLEAARTGREEQQANEHKTDLFL